MSWWVVIVLSLSATLLQAAPPASSAVFGVFKQADARLTHFSLLQRTAVTEELDLVIAIASPNALPLEHRSWIWWTEDRKIGLFLQQKTRPESVYSLGVKSGFPDCAARIERVTATDSVISCQGEKSERYPNQKWVYDVRAKSLIRQFSYRPFAMSKIFTNAKGAVFVGTDTQRLVAVEYDAENEPALRVLAGTDAQRWIDRVHTTVGTVGIEARRFISIENNKASLPAAIPPLPRTRYDQFAAARPQRVKDGYVPAGTEIQDSIGPWQKEDRQVWFGKSFYDGEGSTGVGGFGYFDMDERKFHILSPPEIADSSVSAIEVEPNAVWMALVYNGEYGGSSRGLLRYDRNSGTVRRFELPDIGIRLLRVGGQLLVATDFGIAVVDGDRVTRYFIDYTSDGRLRVVAATR